MRHASTTIIAAVFWFLNPASAIAEEAVAVFPELAPPNTSNTAPNDTAVVIGIQNYDALPEVRFAKRDASLFQMYLQRTVGVLPDRISNLHSTSPAKEDILAALKKRADEVKPGGTLWIYFAGHGAPTKDGEDALLLGVDTRGNLRSFRSRSVSRLRLVEITERSRAERIVVVLDACFSGKSRDGEQLVEARFSVPIPPAKRERVAVWSAAQSDQISGSCEAVGHGLFTYFAVGALSGWAGSGVVTLSAAQEYTKRAMGAALSTGEREQSSELIAEKSIADWSPARVPGMKTNPDLAQLSIRSACTLRMKTIGEREEDWRIGGINGVIVAFETEPSGAMVLLDKKVICQSTPCSKLIPTGPHTVDFQMESYLPVREIVEVNDGTASFNRTLTPDFGWLSVRSEPSGLSVTLDEKPWGTTPVVRKKVSSGPHLVLVTDPRYFNKGKEVVIRRGKQETVAVELSSREGGLQVHARDNRGNDLRARVLLDGQEIGKTPFTGKVIVGEHRVRVVHGEEYWSRTVTVLEKQVEKLGAVFDVGEVPQNTAPSPHRFILKNSNQLSGDNFDFIGLKSITALEISFGGLFFLEPQLRIRVIDDPKVNSPYSGVGPGLKLGFRTRTPVSVWAHGAHIPMVGRETTVHAWSAGAGIDIRFMPELTLWGAFNTELHGFERQSAFAVKEGFRRYEGSLGLSYAPNWFRLVVSGAVGGIYDDDDTELGLNMNWWLSPAVRVHDGDWKVFIGYGLWAMFYRDPAPVHIAPSDGVAYSAYWDPAVALSHTVYLDLDAQLHPHWKLLANVGGGLAQERGWASAITNAGWTAAGLVNGRLAIGWAPSAAFEGRLGSGFGMSSREGSPYASWNVFLNLIGRW